MNTSAFSVIETDTSLKLVARKDGGEYAGPCPFCGGEDRFHVWPDHPEGLRWRCFGPQAGRNGCGRGGDLLAYLVERGDVTPQEAGRRRRNEGGPVRPRPTMQAATQAAPARHVSVKDAPAPPPAPWRAQARRFVGYCSAQLFADAGREALAYLRARGLTDGTIRDWGLGWHEKARRRPAERWGLQGKPVWLMRGVVIPWIVAGEVWHVKIRRFGDHGPLTAPGKKYAQVTQGRPTLYGLERLAGRSTVVICEAELDAVLLWQEAEDLTCLDVVAIGSKGSKVPLAVLTHLAGAKRWLVALDNDADVEANAWGAFSARVRRACPPRGNDLTEYHQAGGDLREWVLNHLDGKAAPVDDLEPVRPDTDTSTDTCWHGKTLASFEDLAEFKRRHGLRVVRSHWSGEGPVVIECEAE